MFVGVGVGVRVGVIDGVGVGVRVGVSDGVLVMRNFLRNHFRTLQRLFACALYDFGARQLLLVRDRVGVKPLYFTAQRGVTCFASELKVFNHIDWIKKDISPLAWYHYLTFMSTPAPYTFFKDIYKLPAGYLMKVDVLGPLS